jgi:hypothetical protein
MKGTAMTITTSTATKTTTGTTTTGVARVITVSGRPYGTPAPSVGCGETIDHRDDYLALVDYATGAKLVGAAHHARWTGPGDDDYDRACPDALRRLWLEAVAGAGAAVLSLGADGGGPRFYAGDVALHAGTALDVLSADGTWLAGRFEYVIGPRRWQPVLYVGLAGFDTSPVALALTEDAIVRIP